MRSRGIVSLMAAGLFGTALFIAAPAGAADISVTELLPTDVPTLIPEETLRSDPSVAPIPEPLASVIPEPGAGSGGAGGSPAPEGQGEPGSEPGSGAGSDSGSGPSAGAGGSDGPASAPAEDTTADSAGDAAAATGRSVTQRASTLTGSAGTLAANVLDLAGPLSIPLGLMAAAAAALIIATRRPSALRKVDEEGTWGNAGRSHRL